MNYILLELVQFELEKIAQISQWIIDYLVWIENSKIIFEEN